MTIVTRRVIKPLHTMRDAMLKVAAGDLYVDTGYAERHDEIGALAGALGHLQAAGGRQGPDRSAGARAQRRRHGAAAGHRELCRRVREPWCARRSSQLGDASGQMRTTSAGLSAVSRQTNERVQVAEKASGEASMSVETVAAASEELSASINDISQQAAHAAGIASRAVGQARETDGTVQGLAQSAGRIGEVVGLINDHRRADQSAGAERHHRGGARRRGRPRLCGGRLRSQVAGEPDREGDRGNLRADRRHPEGGRRGHRRHQGHRRHHRRGQRGRNRDCRRRRSNRALRRRRSRAARNRPRRAPRTCPTTSSA